MVLKSMSQRLYEYQTYSNQILEILRLVPKSAIPQENWLPEDLSLTMTQFEQHAQAIADKCDDPITIGIMGEFSGGKTLLLGGLIGYAGLLPTGNAATTGNITAIHLVQQPEYQKTEVSEAIVHYLSEAGVKDCLIYMLAEAQKLFPETQRAALDGLIKGLEQTGQIQLDLILNWCKQAWSPESAKTRYLIYEIVTFLQTYQAYGSQIEGRNYSLKLPVLEAGLKFNAPISNILEKPFRELLKTLECWESSTSPSAYDLRNSFSLIRRIDLTVKISKEIWDLSALKGTNDFILLDCPGLGSESSRVRDSFLALRELREAQTILLLLDSMKPGNMAASEIRNQLEADRNQLEQNRDFDLRDRIIVVGGRFDLLSLSEAEKQQLSELCSADKDAEKLSPQKVYDELDSLNRLVISAGNLTSETKNIVLASPLYGLAKLAKRSQFEVCSEKFLPELDKSYQEQDVFMRDQWQTLSDRLISGSLQQQLSSYVEDGGISRLRLLITEHVAKHGMKLFLEDIERKKSKCREKQLELQRILERVPQYIPPVEDPNFLALRNTIQSLVSIYRQFSYEVEIQSMLKNCHGVAISDVVKNELINRIFDWTEWRRILNKTRKGVVVLPREEEEDLDGGMFPGMVQETKEFIPTQSDHFYELFVNTLDEMKLYIHKQSQDAIACLISDLAQRVEPDSINLIDFVNSDTEARIRKQGNATETNLFIVLSVSLNPRQLEEQIIQKIQTNALIEALDTENAFPLARNQDSWHPNGQVFHWSPDKKFQSSLPFHHQVMVTRIRDEMIASASLHLNQVVSEVSQNAKSEVCKRADLIVTKLQDLLKFEHEELLRDIASADKSSKTSMPAWLEPLSKISSIVYPS